MVVDKTGTTSATPVGPNAPNAPGGLNTTIHQSPADPDSFRRDALRKRVLAQEWAGTAMLDLVTRIGAIASTIDAANAANPPTPTTSTSTKPPSGAPAASKAATAPTTAASAKAASTTSPSQSSKPSSHAPSPTLASGGGGSGSGGTAPEVVSLVSEALGLCDRLRTAGDVAAASIRVTADEGFDLAADTARIEASVAREELEVQRLRRQLERETRVVAQRDTLEAAAKLLLQLPVPADLERQLAAARAAAAAVQAEVDRVDRAKDSVARDMALLLQCAASAGEQANRIDKLLSSDHAAAVAAGTATAGAGVGAGAGAGAGVKKSGAVANATVASAVHAGGSSGGGDGGPPMSNAPTNMDTSE